MLLLCRFAWKLTDFSRCSHSKLTTFRWSTLKCSLTRARQDFPNIDVVLGLAHYLCGVLHVRYFLRCLTRHKKLSATYSLSVLYVIHSAQLISDVNSTFDRRVIDVGLCFFSILAVELSMVSSWWRLNSNCLVLFMCMSKLGC